LSLDLPLAAVRRTTRATLMQNTKSNAGLTYPWNRP